MCLIKILTDQTIKEDVDELLGNENQATIMFALVCLQVAFPDIYNLLNNYPDFWNWNEAVAARVTHKKETKPPYDDFEEDSKEKRRARRKAEKKALKEARRKSKSGNSDDLSAGLDNFTFEENDAKQKKSKMNQNKIVKMIKKTKKKCIMYL